MCYNRRVSLAATGDHEDSSGDDRGGKDYIFDSNG